MEIYKHPRDHKTGKLTDPPKIPKKDTYLDDMMAFEGLCNAMNVSKEDRDKGIQAIKDRHGKT